MEPRSLKRRRPAPPNPDDPILLEINQLAGHWHRQIERLSYELNGRYASVLHDAENTEERLDGLWLRRRKMLAKPDAERFKDEVGQCSESVFDTLLHIGTCS